MGCIRFQINGNILRCRDGQGAVKELSILQLQGLFLNVIVEDAAKDVVVVLAVDRLTIDYDIEILYNFANCIPFFSSSTLTAFLAAVLCWSRTSVLAARAGAERLNIIHAASAAEAARRAKIFRFIGVPPLRKLLRGGGMFLCFKYRIFYRILEAKLRESP